MNPDLLVRVLQADPAAVDEARYMLPWWDRHAVDRCDTSAADAPALARRVDELTAELAHAEDHALTALHALRDTAIDALGEIKAQLDAGTPADLAALIDAAMTAVKGETWL